MASIFVPLIGQFDNIGDIVLRRELVDWFRAEDELHVYLGHSPRGYELGLTLPPNAVVYFGVWDWAKAMLQHLVSERRVVYIFKPGEIQLTWRGLKEHLGLLPLVVATRLRGGLVFRVGSGARNFHFLPTLILKSTLRLSHFTAWRDLRSAEKLGVGGSMPDLGFGQGRGFDSGLNPRDRLTITMRGDRRSPSATWLAAVQSVSRTLGLRLTVVTQVMRDEEMSARLAENLGAEYFSWDSLDHVQQEETVRKVFRESRLVVSDRLHALIVAATEGSAVVSVSDEPTDKIGRHFDSAGIPIDVIDSSVIMFPEIVTRLERAAGSIEAQEIGLQKAVLTLTEIRASLLKILKG